MFLSTLPRPYSDLSGHIRFAAAILLLLLTTTGSASEASNKISVCVDDWPPHIIRESQDPLASSPLLLAMQAIFLEAGYQIDIIWAPWARGMANVKKGIWDTSPGWAVTPDREEDILFSETTNESFHQFFALKESNFHWEDWTDLKDLRVGVTIGYNYGETFEDLAKSGVFKTQEALTDRDNLIKLINKRIDLFVINHNAAWATAERALTPDQVNKLSLHPKPMNQKKSAVIFNKSEEGRKLRDAFNSAVARMKTENRYYPLFAYLQDIH